MKTSFRITDLSTLGDTVHSILDQITVRKGGGATVLGLQGDLGTGKTTFVQTLATILGVDDSVTSPTFVIMKKYTAAHEVYVSLIHIDAYRIESVDEMRVLGLEDMFAQKGTIICIEWAERIAEILPKNTTWLTFSLDENTVRTLTVSYAEEN